MKVAVQLALFSTGLLVVLVAGFFGLIDVLGHENVVSNLLLLPLSSTLLTVMYSKVYDFVESLSFSDVAEPLTELNSTEIESIDFQYNHN